MELVTFKIERAKYNQSQSLRQNLFDEKSKFVSLNQSLESYSRIIICFRLFTIKINRLNLNLV